MSYQQLTKATLALALLSGAAAAPAPRAPKAHGLIISKEQNIDEAWRVPFDTSEPKMCVLRRKTSRDPRPTPAPHPSLPA